MTHYIRKFHANFILLLLITLSSTIFCSCSKESANEVEIETEIDPGQSLGIVSIPNLRDLGDYKTANGESVATGLLFRSNELYDISESDMLLLANLNLKNVFDLRRNSERDEKPDELPAGVNGVCLDVLSDLPPSGSSNLGELLANPQQANIELGDGKVEEKFKESYRLCITLPSARDAYSELFLSLGDENSLPALFHCATGKDRTGWAAAAFLTIMGVPEEAVMDDYINSNEYILPLYETIIQEFVDGGGYLSIAQAFFGVKEEYLNAAFDEMNREYGTIENYFSEGLGISVEQQNEMRSLYLVNK